MLESFSHTLRLCSSSSSPLPLKINLFLFFHKRHTPNTIHCMKSVLRDCMHSHVSRKL
ncbi:hypothetical protein Sjap_018061 [Stephania japonica]|uniref:Uncharacterized protein n=1 Tax=Stephania japonica TaxID=461633 RepID=A0AAP0I797_9MAGN